MMRAITCALLVAAAPARADDHREANGLAAGVELGEPTSATAAWRAGKLAVSGAVGSGTLAGVGLSAHLDVHVAVLALSRHLELLVGLGGRYYHHGYRPMSLDEIPDTHEGIRAPITLAYQHDRLQLYAELAPGIDVRRTASCSLVDGPQSICPHAQESPFFLQLVIGARWSITR